MIGQKQLLLPLECLVRPLESPTSTAGSDQKLRQKWHHRAYSWLVHLKTVLNSYTNFPSPLHLSPVGRWLHRDGIRIAESSIFLLCKTFPKIFFFKQFSRLNSIPPSSSFYRPFIAVKCNNLIRLTWSSCFWLISTQFHMPADFHFLSPTFLSITFALDVCRPYLDIRHGMSVQFCAGGTHI